MENDGDDWETCRETCGNFMILIFDELVKSRVEDLRLETIVISNVFQCHIAIYR